MKIGIVGCGMVGSTSAYALVMSGVGREIVLVDLNRARAEAEANDIYHAVPFAHPLSVRAGTAGTVIVAGDCLLAVGTRMRLGSAGLVAGGMVRIANPRSAPTTSGCTRAGQTVALLNIG